LRPTGSGPPASDVGFPKTGTGFAKTDIGFPPSGRPSARIPAGQPCAIPPGNGSASPDHDPSPAAGHLIRAGNDVICAGNDIIRDLYDIIRPENDPRRADNASIRGSHNPLLRRNGTIPGRSGRTSLLAKCFSLYN